MKDLEFPMFKTKSSDSTVYDLNSPMERKKYFMKKAGEEIAELREYLSTNTFVAYLLGKKQAGKGTYTKLLAEALELENVKHLSVGDLVRPLDAMIDDKKAKSELFDYLKKNYRGYISLEDAFDAFTSRDTSKLLPTEFILTLVKREIELSGKVNLCIDGFPRNLDQISYSLYFRELIGYRDDPDIFVLIDVPEAVIDERIKARRVCPKCNMSRNLTLFPTSIIEYDSKTKDFHILCDSEVCTPTRMVGKEGDDKGIELIRDRLEMDDELIRKAFTLHGIPKITLRSSVPVEIANEIVDEYEITPKSTHTWDTKRKKVEVKDEPWTYIDDNGIESSTLRAPAVTLGLIRGLYDILTEGKS